MKAKDKLLIILEVITIALSLFMVYQLLRIIFGGSWSVEDFIIGLIVSHIILTSGLAIKSAKDTARLSSDLKHLSSGFRELKADFKGHTEKFSKLATDFELHLRHHTN